MTKADNSVESPSWLMDKSMCCPRLVLSWCLLSPSILEEVWSCPLSGADPSLHKQAACAANRLFTWLKKYSTFGAGGDVVVLNTGLTLILHAFVIASIVMIQKTPQVSCWCVIHLLHAIFSWYYVWLCQITVHSIQFSIFFFQKAWGNCHLRRNC